MEKNIEQDIMGRIFILKSAILSLKNNVFNDNTKKAIKKCGFNLSNNVEDYEILLQMEYKKLTDKALYENNVNELKLLRNKYIVIEEIKKRIELFNNYEEFLLFLEIDNNEINDKIVFINKKISEIIRTIK